MANTIVLSPVLKNELQDFRATLSDIGTWRFGAREDKHDDLVLSAKSKNH